MEEIEGRFELIRIAVHLGDYEVIDSQIRRLRNMSTDKHLHAILYELESKNFRQALYMMRDYAETLRDDFFDPSTREADPATSPLQTDYRFADGAAASTKTFAHASPRSHTEGFPSPARHSERDLFNLSNPVGGERAITLDEMLAMTKETATEPRRDQHPEPVDRKGSDVPVAAPEPQPAEFMAPDPAESSDEPDPLFTLDQDIDFEPEPVSPTPTEDERDQEKETVETASSEMTPLFGEGDELGLGDDLLTFSGIPEQDETSSEETPDVAEEPVEVAGTDAGIFTLDEPSLFDGATPDTEETAHAEEAVSPPVKLPEPSEPLTEEVPLILETEETSRSLPETDESLLEPAPKGDTEVSSPAVEEDPRPRRWEFEPDEDDIMYEKFPYMGQKFRIMMHRYPTKEEVEGGIIDEVKDFIHMVSVRDYSESQVEAAVARYQELKKQGRIGKAAQMLIAAATTESKFAQFMLARELFKGEVLQQDFPESFTQINRLAEEDYPEAICDLGQLYEYGIGIDKNKQHALLLYEEAAQMGVERARRHYDRLRNSNPIQSIKSLATSLFQKKK